MANRFWVSGGTGNYSSTSNWSTTSGGAGGSSVPTSADAVLLDANSPSMIVDAVASAAASVNCTGFTNTITVNARWEVSGSVTLVSAMTLAGTAELRIMASGTLTSAGKTIPWGLTINNGTLTLADDATVTGLFTTSRGLTDTINGNNIHCFGGITHDAQILGTTTCHLRGGNFTFTNNSDWRIPLVINHSGSSTWSSLVLRVNSCTWTYVAGTISASGMTIDHNNQGAITLNTGPIVFGTINLDGNTNTITGTVFTGVLNISPNFATVNNGGNVSASGNVTINASSTGTTTVTMTGTGTLNITGNSTVSVIINSAGTVTISNIHQTGGTITYTAGTLSGRLAVTPAAAVSFSFGYL